MLVSGGVAWQSHGANGVFEKESVTVTHSQKDRREEARMPFIE